MTKLNVARSGKEVTECKISSEILEGLPEDPSQNEADTNDLILKTRWKSFKWWLFILAVIALILVHSYTSQGEKFSRLVEVYSERSGLSKSCKISLVESIPMGLNYSDGAIIQMSTYDAWMTLITSAESTIDIASMYWTMRREDVYPDDSAIEGEKVFEALNIAGTDKKIKLRIAQSPPSKLNPGKDTKYLMENAGAQVRTINLDKLLGAGILHTKMWIIDSKHVYVGSPNMDWRALTQIKELGFLATDCPGIAADLSKIFDVYWLLGKDNKIPTKWPEVLNTNINVNNPMNLAFAGNRYKSFFSSSPPQLSPSGRTSDLEAILTCISRAKKFVYISVMDYFPLMIYSSRAKFWPDIDNALRAAAIDRKVTVRLLISWWKHSRKSENYFLKSLEDISDSYEGVKIEVKRFIVPSTADQDKIPFCRVSHNKYMVTDNDAYIGTSNWSGDYFENTAGVSGVFENDPSNDRENLRQQLEDVFNRDWNSPYATDTQKD